MTADDFPKLFQEAWAVYEALRRFGFADDDVTNLAAPTVLADGTASPEDYLHVVLNAQGARFDIVIAPLDRPFAEAQQEVLRLRTAIFEGTLPEPELQKMWDRSRMADMEWFSGLAQALIARGFALPALAN